MAIWRTSKLPAPVLRANQHDGGGASVAPPQKTAKKLAQEYGVGERTIHNDATFAQAVDAVAATGGEEVKQTVLVENKGASDAPLKTAKKLARAVAQQARRFRLLYGLRLSPHARWVLGQLTKLAKMVPAGKTDTNRAAPAGRNRKRA